MTSFINFLQAEKEQDFFKRKSYLSKAYFGLVDLLPSENEEELSCSESEFL